MVRCATQEMHTEQEGECPVGVAIHGIDSDAEPPEIIGLGIGLAEPGGARTVKDGMPFGAAVSCAESG